MDRLDLNHQYPPVPTDLSRRLQVIGAGLPRTGTSSLCRAVEILLHGPSCHAGSIVLKREESYIKKWISILNPTTKVAADNFFGYFLVGLVSLFERLPTSKAEEIDVKKILKELLDGYVVTADAAAIFFVGEIAEVYPEAKVICMVRDPNKWFASYKNLIKSHNSIWGNILTFIRPTNRLYISWMSGIVERRKHIYPPGKDDPFVMGPEFMRVHEDYIRRVVPPEQLFFYDIKDGWEPLCKILDCPVPSFPFPHEYDAKDMAATHAKLRDKGRKEWIRVLKWPVFGIVVGILGWLCTLKPFS